MSTIAAIIGRILLAVIFISAGIGKIVDPAGTAAYIESATTLPGTLALPTGVFELVLGLMLAVHLNIFSQGWFMAKLVLVILLTGYQGWITSYGRKLANGHRALDDKRLRMMNEVPGILTALIVVLVIVRPF